MVNICNFNNKVVKVYTYLCKIEMVFCFFNACAIERKMSFHCIAIDIRKYSVEFLADKGIFKLRKSFLKKIELTKKQQGKIAHSDKIHVFKTRSILKQRNV